MVAIIDIEQRKGITTVWLNRPQVANAFNATLINELAAALQALERDPDVRVVVLAGRGKQFCAGADLTWMQRAAGLTAEENRADALQLAELLRTLSELTKPTLARVHGAALGGGLGLVAACDLAVASTDARFAATEVRLGLIPAVISPYVIRAIGPRCAQRYFLTAERFDAHRARELGLVSEVVATEQLDERIDQFCESLQHGGPHALRSAKELIRAVAHRPLDAVLRDDTATRIAEQRASAEGREGIAAFLEKRAPEWVAPQ